MTNPGGNRLIRIKITIGLFVAIIVILFGGSHVNINYWPWQKEYWK